MDRYVKRYTVLINVDNGRMKRPGEKGQKQIAFDETVNA